MLLNCTWSRILEFLSIFQLTKPNPMILSVKSRIYIGWPTKRSALPSKCAIFTFPKSNGNACLSNTTIFTCREKSSSSNLNTIQQQFSPSWASDVQKTRHKGDSHFLLALRAKWVTFNGIGKPTSSSCSISCKDFRKEAIGVFPVPTTFTLVWIILGVYFYFW